MAGHKQQPRCQDVIKRAQQCAANNSGLVGLIWGWKVALWSLAHVPFFSSQGHPLFPLLSALCLDLSAIHHISISYFHWLPPHILMNYRAFRVSIISSSFLCSECFLEHFRAGHWLQYSWMLDFWEVYRENCTGPLAPFDLVLGRYLVFSQKWSDVLLLHPWVQVSISFAHLSGFHINSHCFSDFFSFPSPKIAVVLQIVPKGLFVFYCNYSRPTSPTGLKRSSWVAQCWSNNSW